MGAITSNPSQGMGPRRPIDGLKKAFYGHPDAGTYWEQKWCTNCHSVGFEPIADWPPCYFPAGWDMMLVVYVDEFKLSGPEHLPYRTGQQVPTGAANNTSSKSGKKPVDDSAIGVLRIVAARILMKVLYGARMARYDLLRAMCRLACFVTKWTP